MKFSVEKNLLLSAVTTASRAAAAKSAVPALEGLLIETGGGVVKVSGYDLKTGIVTTVPVDILREGKLVLSARLFGDIIRKLPDGAVTISSDDTMITTIDCVSSQFQIIGTPAADYPELPAVDYQYSLSITEKKLKNMIAQTNFAVSDNVARPILTGALFESENGFLTIAACDGYRLALRREPLLKSDSKSLSFVVPGTALAEVEKILGDGDGQAAVMLGSKHIMFVAGGTVLIARRLEGEFINYKSHILSTEKYSVQADRRLLLDAVERVSLIINDKLKSPVRCTFSKDILRLLTSTALGRATDECPVAGDGENTEVGFDRQYLLEALRAAPADRISINIMAGSTPPCLILPSDGGGSFLYMIAPMRIKASEG